jgi:hypothetical protein
LIILNFYKCVSKIDLVIIYKYLGCNFSLIQELLHERRDQNTESREIEFRTKEATWIQSASIQLTRYPRIIRKYSSLYLEMVKYNETLEREAAHLYQELINQFTTYKQLTSVKLECSFKQKYLNLLKKSQRRR